MFIYKTTCLINDKIYIGKSQNKRIRYLGSGNLIKEALRQYGKNNFVKEILEENIPDRKTLNLREIYWIAFFNSNDPLIGYNITRGGDGMLGHKHSPETIKKMKSHSRDSEFRRKISIANKGRVRSDEVKKRISETKKGKRLSEEVYKRISEKRIGSHHTEATKRKMSESQMGEKNHNFGEIQSQERRDKESRGMQGKKKVKNSSSKYVGVMWSSQKNKWQAIIQFRNKRKHLGFFIYEKEAAMAYNNAAIQIYGAEANLNYLEGDK